MPIYEYRCHKCGKAIEIMQKFSDKPLSRCPSCSGKVSRVISNCSFHLKGVGWYVTDYKKKDRSEAQEKESKPQKSEEPSSKPEKEKS